MQKLTGPQADQFIQVLMGIFDLQTFQRMLFFKLNRELYDYAAPGNRQQVFFELIRAANQENWIDRVLMAARESAPTDSKLLAFAEQFRLATTWPYSQRLERIIQEANRFVDPDLLRARLGALEPRVCRLEIKTGQGRLFGTGFLVSPSVIMTNYHVVNALIPTANGGPVAPPPPADALARFDYKRMYDATGQQVGVNEGRTCAFADAWLVDWSPPTPDGQLPTASELDYALVQLRETVGDDRLDGGANQVTPVTRGFIDIPTNTPAFGAGDTLYILQHPRGETLKLAMDTRSVLGLFDDGARVRYTTNTEPGSSGSPCFNPDWELAALHHSGDSDFDPQHKPTYNEGIPIAAIASMITQHGHAAAVGNR